MEEASRYLAHAQGRRAEDSPCNASVRRLADRCARPDGLRCASPACLGIGVDAAAGIGLCVMLCIAAAAVVHLHPHRPPRRPSSSFSKKRRLRRSTAWQSMVRERKKEFGEQYSRLCAVGTALCVPLGAADLRRARAFCCRTYGPALGVRSCFCCSPRSAAMPLFTAVCTARR